jgi:hypothetical protein
MAKKRAPLKNSKPDRRADNPGRPSRYNPEFHPKAAKALCSKGATTAEIADAFGVCIATIWNLKGTYPEFTESCRLGAAEADDRVERSFYERAVGYTFDSVKVMQSNGAPLIVPHREHVPPDTRACEFWLTNRRPDRWKNKQSLEHNEAADSPIRLLAQQISGNAIRPRIPESKIIEHDAVDARGIRQQQQQSALSLPTEPSVTTLTTAEARPASVTTARVTTATGITPSGELRVHTVSHYHEDDDDDA